MRRAKRKEKKVEKVLKIERYWTEETNELLLKAGATVDSNEEGTAPNMDPTIPLLQHIMAAVGSLVEVRDKYAELGPDFRTPSTEVGEYFTDSLVTSLKGIVENALQYNIHDDSQKASAVSHLTVSRSALEYVSSIAKDVKGSLLLHEIMEKSSNNDTVAFEATKLVTKANNEAVKTPDSRGRLPLHKAARSATVKMDIIQRLLEGHGEAPQIPDEDGWLPLHHAVSNERLNMTLIEHLISSYPAASMKQTADGSTPLHVLARAHRQRCEDCYLSRSGRDMSDLAGLKEGAVEVAQLLLRANQKCARVAMQGGFLPLHLSCDTFCPDTGFIKQLTDTYGKGLKSKNDIGELPIHMLLRRLRLPQVCSHDNIGELTSAFDQSIKVLLEFVLLDKECAAVPAADGSLPLHIALFFGFGGTDFPGRRLSSLLKFQQPHPKLEPTVPDVSEATRTDLVKKSKQSTTGKAEADQSESKSAISPESAEDMAPRREGPTEDSTLLSQVERDEKSDEEEDMSDEVLFDASEDFITLIERLMTAYPEATKHANASGLLPMHIVASSRRISLPVLKELLRKNSHVVTQPVVDSHPSVTSNDVRLLGVIRVNKGGVKDVPWCLAWHGQWHTCEFTPLSRAYDRRLLGVANAMKKGAISLLGILLKDSLDKIVEDEKGLLKVATPVPHIAKGDPRFLKKRIEYYSDGDEEDIELDDGVGKMDINSKMFRTAGF